MIWFLERGGRRLACELRRSEESDLYEFAVESPEGRIEKAAYQSPTELIDAYLRRHAQLQADGWRPKVVESGMFG